MKTLFDKSTRDDLINRINSLNENSQAQWGKMNVYQMMKHCVQWDEMVITNKKSKRVFIGILLGKLMLKNELKDDRPMRHNSPTVPELIIKETQGDIQYQKTKWIASIREYEKYAFPDNSFVHPFFGEMTKEQIGYHSYKHADHHLRQFKS